MCMVNGFIALKYVYRDLLNRHIDCMVLVIDDHWSTFGVSTFFAHWWWLFQRAAATFWIADFVCEIEREWSPYIQARIRCFRWSRRGHKPWIPCCHSIILSYPTVV